MINKPWKEKKKVKFWTKVPFPFLAQIITYRVMNYWSSPMRRRAYKVCNRDTREMSNGARRPWNPRNCFL